MSTLLDSVSNLFIWRVPVYQSSIGLFTVGVSQTMVSDTSRERVLRRSEPSWWNFLRTQYPRIKWTQTLNSKYTLKYPINGTRLLGYKPGRPLPTLR